MQLKMHWMTQAELQSGEAELQTGEAKLQTGEAALGV